MTVLEYKETAQSGSKGEERKLRENVGKVFLRILIGIILWLVLEF